MFDSRVADKVEWSRPWLAGLREQALMLLVQQNWLQACNQAASHASLVNAQFLPIQFVPQQSVKAGVAYEAHIYETGDVPTRDNLHDFFNALIWLHFPKTKSMLNALQATELKSTKVLQARGIRGTQRDAATLFDENAALLVCSEPEYAEALRGHQWQEILFHKREGFLRSCEVILFGHALMEKLVQPYKAITAHTWVVIVEPQWHGLAVTEKLSWLDTALAHQLSLGFTVKNFTPLPVLGVPGWWPGQDASFYSDRSVFRPARNQ